MLVGELVADGKLALDAPAPVPEWHRPGDPRGAITLRMLLQMRSGLRHTEIGDPIERSDTNQVLFVGGTGDMAAKAIAQPLEDRKRVVAGKSVSVRVDIGGCRHIKKKKKY